MIDFSKLGTAAKTPAAPESPYAYADCQHFAGKKIMRHTVTVYYADARHPTPGLDDRSYRATVQRDGMPTSIRLNFIGQRAIDFENGELVAQMEAERQVCCEKEDWAAEENISAVMQVEGFWQPRKWKDREGTWHTAWEFFPAVWHFSLNGEHDNVVTEGSAIAA